MTGRQIPPTLVVTGHFPPGHGGVQTFVWELLRRLPADRLVVVAPDAPGARAADARLDLPVLRRRGYLLTWDLTRVVRRYGCRAAWIPAAAPIGLFAPGVRRAGVDRVVASTHGQELGWLRAAPTRGAVRAIAGSVDALTYLGPRSRELLAAVVPDPGRLHRLVGGVDSTVFAPGAGGGDLRRRYRLGDAPLAVSVSRLVRRKGQDRLLAAWPAVLAAVPAARLLLVGQGPYQETLRRLADRLGVAGSVTFTGPLPRRDLVGCLDAADVFVAPCRDDRRGLQTEGLGLATLEASATGTAVLVGDSGGSGDAVLDGRTGCLVDARDPARLVGPLIGLLADRPRAARLGAAGREWVRSQWTWDRGADRLADLLTGEPG